MRVAIIGAGFSGCQLTLELLRRARPGTKILLFDGSGTFGPGVAFAAGHSRLLLNTRVANMSLFEDDRSHFLRWLWAKDLPEHPAGSIPPSGHAFVSRGLYGRLSLRSSTRLRQSCRAASRWSGSATPFSR